MLEVTVIGPILGVLCKCVVPGELGRVVLVAICVCDAQNSVAKIIVRSVGLRSGILWKRIGDEYLRKEQGDDVR